MKLVERFISVPTNPRSGKPMLSYKGICLHWFENAGADAEFHHRYFNDTKRKASYHFLVDDNQVINIIPTNEVAWHCGTNDNFNYIGIGIYHRTWKGDFSDETIKQLQGLINMLCRKFDLDPSVQIKRHYDFAGKKCPLYYVDNPDEWNKLIHDLSKNYLQYLESIDKLEE